MHRRDAPIGASFLLLALAVLWHVRDVPPAPGQPYGPALFPGLIAAGLAACSTLLLVSALRARYRGGTGQSAESGVISLGSGRVPSSPQGDSKPLSPSDSSSGWLAFAVTLGALIGYIALVDRLGFLPTAVLMLGALLWAYGVRKALILPLAMVTSLLVHSAFYKVLKVPLPWGLMSGLAW